MSARPAGRWSVLLVALAGCAERPIAPAEATPFIERLDVTRLDLDEPLSETIDLDVNTGFYANIAFIPGSAIPETLDGRSVQPTNDWTLALIIVPRGSDRGQKTTIYAPCNRFARPRERVPPLPYSGAMGIWGPSGYRSPPQKPTAWPQNEYRFWTYFAVPPDQPGDYVYELAVFPTSVWKSLVRSDVGPPVVLKRGVLHVHPVQSQ